MVYDISQTLIQFDAWNWFNIHTILRLNYDYPFVAHFTNEIRFMREEECAYEHD